MVEAGGNGVIEEEVVRCIEFGHECCRKIIAGIRELVAKAGKPKRSFTPRQINEEMFDRIDGEDPRRSDGRHGHREARARSKATHASPS